MKEYDSTVICNQIKKYRIACGLSQKEFASKTGLSKSYVTALEKGNRKKDSSISMETACKIADVLKISLDDLANTNCEYSKIKNTVNIKSEIENELQTMSLEDIEFFSSIVGILISSYMKLRKGLNR